MAFTKAEWRNDKLRFHGAPMFTSVASASTNIRGIGATVETTQLAVSCPIYYDTFTTQRNMSFRAKIAGICATSSGWLVATLRYGTTPILTARTSTATAKHMGYNHPYSFDFSGRIGKASSSGHITATCIVTLGRTTHQIGVRHTTGTTGSGVKMSTSDINLKVNSTLGLNVVLRGWTTSAGAAGTTPAFTNTVAYIELFSG